MKITVCENYDEMSEKAAEIFIDNLKKAPSMTLGLATGSTPIGLYKNLVNAYKKSEISFKSVTTFNLDEYVPITPDNEQSYIYFMKDNLFNHVDMDESKINIPNGQAADPEKEAVEYDKKIEAAGGIDLQLLGVGPNGHIAFNEPGEYLISATHVTGLTEKTIKANSRFFASIDDVPKHALTMGIGPIFSAKKLVVLISGNGKKEVYEMLKTGKITTQCPATLLHLHADCTVLVDKDSIK